MSPEYALPVIQSSQFNGAHNIRPVPVTLSPTYTEYMAPAMIMSPGMGMNMSMNIMHQPFLPPSSPSSATTTTTTTYIDPLSPHQPPRAPPTRPRKSLPVPHHHHPHHNHTPRIYPARRAIFIQNLPPSTSVTDLRSHLESAGPIEACEVFTDRATGLCKGFARVTFQTGEGAKRAVGMGNGSFFWGCRIRVRFDRYFGERGPGGDGEGREGGSVGTGAGTGDGTTNGIAKEETSETSKPAGGCHHQPLVVNGSVSGIGGGRKAEVD